MEVKLKTKTYDLAETERQSNMADGANMLGLSLANVTDINEVIEEATDCEKVEIIDGGVTIRTYEDYTNFMSVSVANDIVDVVMYQPSLVKQVENLKVTVREQKEIIDAQAERIAELQDSQEVQDGDINDLTDAMLEMSEIVYGEEE